MLMFYRKELWVKWGLTKPLAKAYLHRQESPEPPELSQSSRHHHVEQRVWLISPLVSSWLPLKYVSLGPLRSLCHALSSGVNLKHMGRLLPSPSLVGSQTWVSRTARGLRFTFEGQFLTPFNGLRARMEPLRANPEV